MNIINWFLKSSANPYNTSLMIKGILAFYVVLGVDASIIESLSSNIADLIVILGQAITVIITLFGLIRKIILSFR